MNNIIYNSFLVVFAFFMLYAFWENGTKFSKIVNICNCVIQILLLCALIVLEILNV